MPILPVVAGDLASQCGLSEYAKEVYKWSREVLIVGVSLYYSHYYLSAYQTDTPDHSREGIQAVE
jgi:hypothetical protein